MQDTFGEILQLMSEGSYEQATSILKQALHCYTPYVNIYIKIDPFNIKINTLTGQQENHQYDAIVLNALFMLARILIDQKFLADSITVYEQIHRFCIQNKHEHYKQLSLFHIIIIKFQILDYESAYLYNEKLLKMIKFDQKNAFYYQAQLLQYQLLYHMNKNIEKQQFLQFCQNPQTRLNFDANFTVVKILIDKKWFENEQKLDLFINRLIKLAKDDDQLIVSYIYKIKYLLYTFIYKKAQQELPLLQQLVENTTNQQFVIDFQKLSDAVNEMFYLNDDQEKNNNVVSEALIQSLCESKNRSLSAQLQKIQKKEKKIQQYQDLESSIYQYNTNQSNKKNVLQKNWQ